MCIGERTSDRMSKWPSGLEKLLVLCYSKGGRDDVTYHRRTQRCRQSGSR